MGTFMYFMVCFGVVYGQIGFFPRVEEQYRSLRERLPIFRRPLLPLQYFHRPGRLHEANNQEAAEQNNYDYNNHNFPRPNFVKFPDDYAPTAYVSTPYVDNDNLETPAFENEQQLLPNIYGLPTQYPTAYDPGKTPTAEVTDRSPVLVVDESKNSNVFIETDDRFANDDTSAATGGIVGWPSNKDVGNTLKSTEETFVISIPEEIATNMSTTTLDSLEAPKRSSNTEESIAPLTENESNSNENPTDITVTTIVEAISVTEKVTNLDTTSNQPQTSIATPIHEIKPQDSTPAIDKKSNFHAEPSDGWYFPEQPITKPETVPETAQLVETTTAKQKDDTQSKHGLVMIPAQTHDFNSGNDKTFKVTCVTPSSSVGHCVPLSDCAPLYQLLIDVSDGRRALSDVREPLRQAQCGYEGNSPKVCCPISESPPSATTSTTTTTTTAPASPPVDDASSRLDTDTLPQPPVCGISHASVSRVVGGQDAKLGDFPWMALLGYKLRSSSEWKCGGSLISHHHVLTAAHCIKNYEKRLYVVRLGELDLSREDDAAPVDVLIRKMIMHEGYSRNHLMNDVGLLVLEQSVAFTKMIYPICLPQTEEILTQNFEGYKPFAAGWGATEYRGRSSKQLKFVQLPVVSTQQCADSLQKHTGVRILTDKTLCAGYPEGKKDTCGGDSGGPLMQPIWNKKTYQSFVYAIGVVSFGIECAKEDRPGVYTRVSAYMPWIITHMKENS